MSRALSPLARRALLVSLVAFSPLRGTPSVLAAQLHNGEPADAVAEKAFSAQELYLADLDFGSEALGELPNAAEWDRALQEAWVGSTAYFDHRSARVNSLITHLPLLPGNGVGNHLTLNDLSNDLGRPIRAITADVVTDLIVKFVDNHHATLRLDSAELGEIRAVAVTEHLWQVSIAQSIDGVPVRDAGLVATISHGNLVLLGTDNWGDVDLSTSPRLPADEALLRGYDFAGVDQREYPLWKEPQLEIVPVATAEDIEGRFDAIAVGDGYRYRLVWAFGFSGFDEVAAWEVLVDANNGEVLELADRSHAVDAEIRGGIYSSTNTGVCPTDSPCGVLEEGVPMPYADTGQPPPNDFTDRSGGFEASVPVTTSLQGKFVRIGDQCGVVGGVGGVGSLDLGGANGDHDCDVPAGARRGNTAAARSAFYELNRIAEMARGWLPNAAFLQHPITAHVNIGGACNAFYVPNDQSLRFFRRFDGCGNTGEIAGIFDHEWGHALDHEDANGRASNTSEAYADIAAAYRREDSCIGYGFLAEADRSCGRTSDDTGFNTTNDSRLDAPRCASDCSGAREIDFAKLADPVPDTPLGFVCNRCDPGTGPCGRQVHCSSAPVTQAAWDLVTRDLPSPPFGYDSNTAFLVGNKLFFQGSGNVRDWYTCSCATQKAAGCRASTGYMQWLAADDDNGSLTDGTPHMSAIFAAFDRHGIACAAPVPRNSGCNGAPSAAPTATALAIDDEVFVHWTPVALAQGYRVFRAEGATEADGCSIGKVKVAEVGPTTTAFFDREVTNGREACYTVLPIGTTEDCFGPASACTCATPTELPTSLACDPQPLSVSRGGSGEIPCTISSKDGFAGDVELTCGGPLGIHCDPTTVTIPAGGSVVAPLTVSVAVNGVPALTHQITAFAIAGVEVTPAPLLLRVNQLGLACNPTELSAAAGSTVTSNCTLTRSNAVQTPIELDCDGEQDGITCSFAPSVLAPLVDVPVDVPMTITVDATAGGGTYSMAAVAQPAFGGETRSPFELAVPTDESDFQLSCDPIPHGDRLLPTEEVDVACAVSSLNGFSAPVSLDCLHSPLFRCDLDAALVTPPADSSIPFTVRLRVGNAVSPGDYQITVEGRAIGRTHRFDLEFSVDGIPEP